jgi:hypothetical protein
MEGQPYPYQGAYPRQQGQQQPAQKSQDSKEYPPDEEFVENGS